MNGKLRVHADEQMDMVGHHFQFLNLGLLLLANLTDDLFQPCLNRLHQDFSPIFGTPDHMIVAGIGHLPVALVFPPPGVPDTHFPYLLPKHFFPPFPSPPPPQKDPPPTPHARRTRPFRAGTWE